MKVKGCYPVTHWPRHAQIVATSQQVSRDIENLWDRVLWFLVNSPLSLSWIIQLPWKWASEIALKYWWRADDGLPHALHIVSYYGLDGVLGRLLSTGIDRLKLENALRMKMFGGAPLLHAISGGFARAVQRLLDFGVETETRSGWGTTPLGIAARLGNEKITEILLDCGAEIEARDHSGWTPLSHAARSGRKLFSC